MKQKKIYAGLAGVILGIAVLGYGGYGRALPVQAATIKTATVTTSALNVRTGAGAGYDKVISDGVGVFLKTGDTARILGEENGWYQVRFHFQGKELTGYINGSYVEVTEEVVTRTMAKSTATKLNVRSGAGTSYDKVISGGAAAYLQQGESAEVLGQENGWYRVRFTFQSREVTGYVSGDYVTIWEEEVKEPVVQEPSADQEPSDGQQPSADQESPASQEKPDVTVTYLPLEVPVRITATSLKVRTGPGTGYQQLAVGGQNVSVKQNDQVTVIGAESTEAGRWYQIKFRYNGKEQTGYVLSDYTTVVLKAGERVRVDAAMNKKQYVRKTPSTEGKVVTYDGEKVALKKGAECYIISEETVGGQKWFQVKFFVGEKALKGYVRADYVDFRPKAVVTGGSADEGKEPSGSSGQTGTETPETPVTPEAPKIDEDIVESVEYEPLEIPGRVLNDGLVVRVAAGEEKDALKADGVAVELSLDTTITIIDVQKKVSGRRWYEIRFTYGDQELTGYVPSETITLVMIEGERIRVEVLPNEDQNVMTKAKVGEKYYVTFNDEPVILEKDSECYIISETLVDGVEWFQVKFFENGFPMKGYVPAKYVDFPRVEVIPEPVVTPDDGVFQIQQGIVMGGTIQPRVAAGFLQEVNKDSITGVAHTLTVGQAVTAFNVVSADGTDWYMITYEVNGSMALGFVPAANVQLAGSNSVVGTVMTAEEFEAYMNTQGFPESYKPYLRQLHAAHPYWIFEARHVGLDWNTALTNESKVGLNLITNSKALGWKSFESGAYNWKTDKFVPYDGSTWVTASKDAVAYYMDPRNFLTENGIFQFELLSYQPAYQTEAGVEAILAGTPMQYASFTYTDSNGVKQTTTYAKAFMDAAVYSGVSPYHLATRVKQEVVTGKTSMSSSVSGTVSGYEGLYNYYNIGANDSTVAGGAVANGLRYARSGTSGKMYNSTTTFNDYIKIPWTDPYRAIVGGAAFIGHNYIQRGQNTVYLEKFNMTATSTYSHQYMSNVEAGASESAKTAAAYKELAASPLVFSIPVYLNMPEAAAPVPAEKLNPNNWLKSLEVEGYSLTPTFNPASDQMYTLIVSSDVESVNIKAKTVSSKASISGDGVMMLVPGNNTAVLVVTAEDGTPKIYLLMITREIPVEEPLENPEQTGEATTGMEGSGTEGETTE